jgi:hypothetical protein
MTNGVQGGAAGLMTRTADGDTDNIFAVHDRWHLALYGTRIRRQVSSAVLDLFNARAPSRASRRPGSRAA